MSFSDLKGRMSWALSKTPLQYVPVRVRAGLARGARWTLLPRSSNWRGACELEIETAIQMHGDLTGAACWDLGAHFGIYTVGLAMQVGPDGEVAALEPDPVSFVRLQRHVKINRLSNVRLFNAAASASNGTAELVNHGPGSELNHVLNRDKSYSPEKVISVRTFALDSLVGHGEIRGPDFIKIDVEGHAAHALRGMRNSLKTRRPTIVVGLHDAREMEAIRSLAENLRYKCFNSDGSEVARIDKFVASVILLGR